MNPDLKWFALLTRSNFEQTVHDIILKKKIDVFLPKMRKMSRRRDRRLMIEVPLFPGYLFVRSTLAARDQLPIVKTVGAVRLLGNRNQPIPVPLAHVDSLKIMTGAGADLITGGIAGLSKGDPVMVVNGPLTGMRGEFMRYRGQARVVIRLEILGRYSAAEINEEDIEKIPDF